MKNINWRQGTIRYSIFFGTLTLISFLGGYIYYKFSTLFFSKLFYLMAIIFGMITLYWIWKEKIYKNSK